MKLRVAVPCPGVGRVRRGYERFSTDLAEALADRAEVRVFAGRCPPGIPGATIPSPSREFLARLGCSEDRAYYLEQVLFAVAVLPALWAFRPHVIHISDVVSANVLRRLKHALPRDTRILFCNGGSETPEHYAPYDFVHLLGPWQLPDPSSGLMDPARMFVVPLGVFTSKFSPRVTKDEARSKLRLPAGPLAITVAAHVRAHKGVDYLIEELAQPGAAGWSLLWLGQRTAETPELEALIARTAPGRVILRSVDAERVPEYLAAADLFLFASHQEAFGIGLIEAMAAGLPVLVRDIPPFRYIIGDDEQVSSLKERGALVPHLAVAVSAEWRASRGLRNQIRAKEVFDWAPLAPRYLEMYERTLASSK